MASLKVEVSLDSDAMCVDAPFEVAHIFKRITEAFSDYRDPFETHMTLRDSNGNQVGQCWVEED